MYRMYIKNAAAAVNNVKGFCGNFKSIIQFTDNSVTSSLIVPSELVDLKCYTNESSQSKIKLYFQFGL